MNKTKKFMAFIEGMVEDPQLLRTIKKGYRICTESTVDREDDQWKFTIEELEYPVEIAGKYFDLKTIIYDHKKETGVDRVDKEDIVLSVEVYADFNFDESPYMAATRQNPEEGGLTVEDYTITYLALNLFIDGYERKNIEIEDEKILADLDPMLSTAIEKEIEPHKGTIEEKEEELANEGYDNSREETNPDVVGDRDYW